MFIRYPLIIASVTEVEHGHSMLVHTFHIYFLQYFLTFRTNEFGGIFEYVKSLNIQVEWNILRVRYKHYASW